MRQVTAQKPCISPLTVPISFDNRQRSRHAPSAPFTGISTSPSPLVCLIPLHLVGRMHPRLLGLDPFLHTSKCVFDNSTGFFSAKTGSLSCCLSVSGVARLLSFLAAASLSSSLAVALLAGKVAVWRLGVGCSITSSSEICRRDFSFVRHPFVLQPWL